MKKIIVLGVISVLLLICSGQLFAVGGGMVMLPGQIETPDGAAWDYKAGFTPQIGCTFKYNDKISFLLSIVKSSHEAVGKYDQPDGGKLEITGGSLDYLQLITNAKYNFKPDKKIKPYATGGFGLYRWGCDVKAKSSDSGMTVSNKVKTGNNLGLNLGAGVDYEITDKFMVGGEAKYHLLLSDYYKGGALDLIVDFRFGF